MENRISIPKPCHENWNEMLPEQQGRHCLSCSKTVVDFTNWGANDILVYLQQKSSEKICGRFNQDQVIESSDFQNEHLIQNVIQAHIPLLRKIAAVIVICFELLQGSDSYAQKVKGKVVCSTPSKPASTEQLLGEAAIQPDTTKHNQPVIADTTKPQIMGMIAPYKPKEIKKEILRKKKVKR